MSTQINCDGCFKTLTTSNEVGIQGENKRYMETDDNSMGEGRFDWCRECSYVAFTAISRRNA